MIRGLKDENNEYLQQTFLVKQVSQRGRSVFSKTTFKKGDYVIEYKGTCKEYDEHEFRAFHATYEKNGELSYCLEFSVEGKKYLIDATREFEFGIARLINHAKNPNLKLFRPLVVENGKNPRIAIYAATNISVGEELFWDYFSSLNPAKCLLSSNNAELDEIKWIYSRRLKTGKITYKLPKRRISERSGVCVICYKYLKKLSNHLITTHGVSEKGQRQKMILEGRSLKIGDALDAIKPDVKRRRKLTCHICSRDYFQLSTHLARVHKLSPELRRYHVESSKKNVTLKETNVRKNIIDKIS